MKYLFSLLLLILLIYKKQKFVYIVIENILFSFYLANLAFFKGSLKNYFCFDFVENKCF